MTSKEEKDRLRSLEEDLLKYSRDVQKFIFTLTYDQYAMEEVFQNTLLRAYESLPKLREPGKMVPWLFEIAKTETIRHYNKEKKWNRFKEMSIDDVKDESLEDDVAVILEKLEHAKEVVDLLNLLKPKYASVIRAHYIYKLPLIEIAKIKGTNYNTLKTYNSRALSHLKRLYIEKVLK